MTVITKKAPVARQTRVSSCLPAVLHEVGDYPCQATDVSLEGAQLFGDLPVPSTRKVRVTVGSAAGDLALKSAARVVRVVGGEEPGEVVIGVEFVALDARRTEILEKLLATLPQNQAPAPVGAGDVADDRPDAVAQADAAAAEKIERARVAQPAERARFFHDDDPRVMEGLAANPRLSKREITKLVAREQLLPSTILILASHPRAKGDEDLQIQLASHPAAEIDAATLIARGLSAEGLSRLVQGATLSDALREHLMNEFPEASP